MSSTPSCNRFDSADLISEFNASGIVFKDAVQVEALRDPMVDGVTIYLSDFKRSFSAKAQSGDFFSEPSQTALACVRSESAAGVSVKGDVTGFQGQEVFSERKNLNLAPIVAMASKTEGAPKKAKASDERRRAPAAVATAAAAIVASTVASPLAAYRCARGTIVLRRP